MQMTKKPLPEYQCFKKVRALKIHSIDHRDGGTVLVPAEADYPPIEVSPTYMDKHSPQVGGYYVVYADGYTSYSPAKAFETGYTRVEGAGSDA